MTAPAAAFGPRIAQEVKGEAEHVTMQTQVPAKIAEYFGISTSLAYADFPVIAQIFRPVAPGRRNAGWKRCTKRASVSWVRKLKAQGVTSIAVTYDGRTADFSVDEILKHAERPLLGGRVI